MKNVSICFVFSVYFRIQHVHFKRYQYNFNCVFNSTVLTLFIELKGIHDNITFIFVKRINWTIYLTCITNCVFIHFNYCTHTHSLTCSNITVWYRLLQLIDLWNTFYEAYGYSLRVCIKFTGASERQEHPSCRKHWNLQTL